MKWPAKSETPTDDWRSLRQYVEGGSQQAFSELVARHVDLVYSSALRQTRGNRHMAEDVTQAVFLVLATRAASLRQEMILAAWLLVVTRHAARDALKSEARRRRREQAVALLPYAVATMNPNPDTTIDGSTEPWEAIAPELDSALASLRDKDRRVIVLRYLQGQSIEEVARLTSATPAAAKQRLHRAIEQLRTFFRARGVRSVTSASLGPMLLQLAVQPAPPGLARHISTTAFSTAAASVSGISIAKGVVMAMAWTKAKIAVACAAAVLLVAGGTTVAVKVLRKPPERMVVLDATPVSAPAQNMPSTGGGTLLPQPPLDGMEAFDALYSLAENEMLKYVAPPLMKTERTAFYARQYKRTLPEAQRDLQHDPGLFVEYTPKSAKNKVLESRSVSYVSNNSLKMVLFGIHVVPWEVDLGTAQKMKVPGDWVILKLADSAHWQLTEANYMAGLGKQLSTILGQPLHFEKQRKLREVVVARGTYHFTPLKPGNPVDVIDLLGEPPANMRLPNIPTYPGNVASAVGAFSGIAERNVIDETVGPQKELRIKNSMFVVDPDVVAANITKQTGLTLTREMREMDTWCLLDKNGKLYAGPGNILPDFDGLYSLALYETIKHITPPLMQKERVALYAKTSNRTLAEAEGDLKLGYSLFVECAPKDGFNMAVDAPQVSVVTDHSMKSILLLAAHVAPWEVDLGTAKEVSVPGDWVTLKRATEARMMDGLGKELSTILGQTVHFEKQRKIRDVLVARGTYKFAPLKPENPVDEIDLYDGAAPAGSVPYIDGPSVQQTIESVLRACGSKLEVSVIVESASARKAVTMKQRVFFSDGKLLTENVAKQTGLALTREKREMDTWCLVDKEGKLFSGPVPVSTTQPK